MCSEKKTCFEKRVLHDKNKLIGLGTILLDLLIEEIRKIAVSMQCVLLEHAVAQYVLNIIILNINIYINTFLQCTASDHIHLNEPILEVTVLSVS